MDSTGSEEDGKEDREDRDGEDQDREDWERNDQNEPLSYVPTQWNIEDINLAFWQLQYDIRSQIRLV